MTVKELFENGTIKFLLDKGMVSVNMFTYYRYYIVYQAYKDQGLSNNKSYLFTSDECGVSITTIRKAVRLMKESS